jgi:hypothetical protein
MDYNEQECDSLMDRLILNLGFEVSMLKVVYPPWRKSGYFG